jgi:hypothetical protein
MQKDKEFSQLKKTLNLLNLSAYHMLNVDSECPDFIVNIEGIEVGIELTEIYRTSSNENSAKAQSDVPKILYKAVALYNKKCGDPYYFLFGINGDIIPKNPNCISSELAEFLLHYSDYSFPERDASIEINIDLSNYPSLSFITAIQAQKTEGIISACSFVSNFGSVEVEDYLLAEKIEKKSKLINKYREKCQTVWLLIVLPSMSFTSDLRLKKSYNSISSYGFDAVYILDDYRNIVLRIKNA